MQVRAAIADAVDVRPGDVLERLDVTDDVRGEHAQFGRELVGQVRHVVVVARVQHENERDADPADPG